MTFQQNPGMGHNSNDFDPPQATPEEIEAMRRAGEEAAKPRTSKERAQAAAKAVREHGATLASFGIAKARDLMMIRWAEDKRLGREHRLVLAWLSHHTNGKTGYSFPGYGVLAKEAGLSKQTIQNAVSFLAKIGLIAKTNGNQRNPQGIIGPSYVLLAGNGETWEVSAERLETQKLKATGKGSGRAANFTRSDEDEVGTNFTRSDEDDFTRSGEDEAVNFTRSGDVPYRTAEKEEPLKKEEPLNGTVDDDLSDWFKHYSQVEPHGDEDASLIDQCPEPSPRTQSSRHGATVAATTTSVNARSTTPPPTPAPRDGDATGYAQLDLGGGGDQPIRRVRGGLTAVLRTSTGKPMTRHMTAGDVTRFADRLSVSAEKAFEVLSEQFERWLAEGYCGSNANWLGELLERAESNHRATRAKYRPQSTTWEPPDDYVPEPLRTFRL